jgi:regulator of RNase E activity RraB
VPRDCQETNAFEKSQVTDAFKIGVENPEARELQSRQGQAITSFVHESFELRAQKLSEAKSVSIAFR